MPAIPGGTSGGFGRENGPKRCTAMSKRTGEQCKDPAVADSRTQKCRMHGGHNGRKLSGANNGKFKHGRYSRYLPAQLDELYRKALANPDLIVMNDHIALLEARISTIMERGVNGDPVPHWSDIAEAFALLETAILSGDPEKVVPALEQMHKLLDDGQRWDRAWNDTITTLEQLRKMADTEVKRRKELNQMVPIDRVTILMGAVGEAVKRNVTNPLEVEAVYREIAILYGGDRQAKGKLRVGAGEIIDVDTVDEAEADASAEA